jgi:uncharacterized protein YndB with AHSA1/START domain
MYTPEPIGIQWPSEFQPEAAPVSVKNEIEIVAPPEKVWACLIRAAEWPDWYGNAKRVRFRRGSPPDLALGTRFRWWTFQVPIRSEVREFTPYRRLAWDAVGPGIRAYHAWLLTPTPKGCHVLTEEIQHGWGAQLSAFFRPNSMFEGHRQWLESLRARVTGA